jgi:hypothetical protein
VAVRPDYAARCLSGHHVLNRHLPYQTLNWDRIEMKDKELVEKLKSGVEDWNEQARLWDAKGDAELSEKCRAKAHQWEDVIRYLEAKEHA